MLENFLENKTILITGCCGSVGNELLKQLDIMHKKTCFSVIGVDENETKLFFQEGVYPDFRFELVDIRDKNDCLKVMGGVDIVIHTAALKHVIISERAPLQAIYTNIIGTQNLVEAAMHHGISKFIFTSSDKAVNPTNVMGTSKLMGERIVSAANISRQNHSTVFSSTRFGNVLGTNGSVVPIFKKQILTGGPVTITDERMTRFIMSISEAAKLVLDSIPLSQGGEVFVTKMPVISISNLADAMISAFSETKEIKKKLIGIKPGEKLYEELMSDEESARAIELEKYYVVLPTLGKMRSEFISGYKGVENTSVTNPYNSSVESKLTISETLDKLIEYGLIDLKAHHDTSRHWPLI
jgi:FlaA1/EpsC-like NDP-sugar epimerase